MNREEIVTKIQNDINKFFKAYEDVGEDERELLAEMFDDVEKLRKPITLAEFLGWEEGKLYKVKGEEYKVVDNNLYLYLNYDNEFELSPLCFCNYDISILRQAEKIEPKKFYAKIKGWKLINNPYTYWNLDVPNKKLIFSSKREVRGLKTKFTKEEWEYLEITKKNADFEEVKE